MGVVAETRWEIRIFRANDATNLAARIPFEGRLMDAYECGIVTAREYQCPAFAVVDSEGRPAVTVFPGAKAGGAA